MTTWQRLQQSCRDATTPQLSDNIRERRRAAIAHDSPAARDAYLTAMTAELHACLETVRQSGQKRAAGDRLASLIGADTAELSLPLPGAGTVTLLAMAPWHPLRLADAAGLLGPGDGFYLPPVEYTFCDTLPDGWLLWQPSRCTGWPLAALCRRALDLPPAAQPRAAHLTRDPGQDLSTINLVMPGGIGAWLDWAQSLARPLTIRAFVAARMLDVEQAPRLPGIDLTIQPSNAYFADPPAADLTILDGLARQKLSLVPRDRPAGWQTMSSLPGWQRWYRSPLVETEVGGLLSTLASELLTGSQGPHCLGVKAHVPAAALALVHLARHHSRRILIADRALEASLPAHLVSPRPEPLRYVRPASSMLEAAEQRPGYGPQQDA